MVLKKQQKKYKRIFCFIERKRVLTSNDTICYVQSTCIVYEYAHTHTHDEEWIMGCVDSKCLIVGTTILLLMSSYAFFSCMHSLSQSYTVIHSFRAHFRLLAYELLTRIFYNVYSIFYHQSNERLSSKIVYRKSLSFLFALLFVFFSS